MLRRRILHCALEHLRRSGAATPTIGAESPALRRLLDLRMRILNRLLGT